MLVVTGSSTHQSVSGFASLLEYRDLPLYHNVQTSYHSASCQRDTRRSLLIAWSWWYISI